MPKKINSFHYDSLKIKNAYVFAYIDKFGYFVKDGITRVPINLEELPELKQLCMKYLAEAEKIVK